MKKILIVVLIIIFAVGVGFSLNYFKNKKRIVELQQDKELLQEANKALLNIVNRTPQDTQNDISKLNSITDRDYQRLRHVKEISSAISKFSNDSNAQLPMSLSELTPKYLQKLPVAPEPIDGNCTIEQNRYVYRLTKDQYGNSDYELMFCLGQGAGAYKAGIHRLTSAGIE